MVDLAKRQRKLWGLFQIDSPVQPMLRISRENDCYWICDLPRRVDHSICAVVRKQIEAAGFMVCFHEESQLWHIDLKPDDPLYTEIPAVPIPLPQNALFHPAYALYQMLKKHPSPFRQQPLPLLRSLLKFTLQPPQESQLLTLTSQCAALLNRKQPLPYAACYALAQWICQEDAK
ncbi:MAG: hypothetical protein E7323_01620 [Clostridiales bacterium]|nr:hypothetical protein [Clostridiales bacterium]